MITLVTSRNNKTTCVYTQAVSVLFGLLNQQGMVQYLNAGCHHLLPKTLLQTEKLILIIG